MSKSVVLGIPTIFTRDGKTLAISSMIASTIVIMFLTTVFPSLMPLWMSSATRTPI